MTTRVLATAALGLALTLSPTALRAQSDPVDPRLEEVRTALRVGRYQEALNASWVAEGTARATEFLFLQGEAHRALGEWQEAEQAYGRAASAGYLPARLRVGELLFDQGRLEEAREIFDAFIDLYNQGEARTAADLVAVGDAVRYLGAAESSLFSDALRAYDEALVTDAGSIEARLAIGHLFLEKYQPAEARPLFREVLEMNPDHPEAHLGMALASEFDGTGDLLEPARAALEVNPQLADARALVARTLVGGEDFDGAGEEIAEALRVNPRHGELLAVAAAIPYLTDDTTAWRDRRREALESNPRDAAFFARLGEMAVQNRRYADAVALTREGVALDSLHWASWGLLGINLLRVGEMEEGRQALETAFAGDPFNPWFKNSLDLLDELDRFAVLETEHFQFVMDPDEAELIGPLAARVAEEAFDTLSARYAYTPPLPIRVEIFPRHADFSVRTLGLTGLGALGVSFGSVLAMDSPSARPRGQFNWGATLWHEVAHAFHLGYTNHRIPRWLAEGMAVFEERHGHPGWGHELTMTFLAARAQGMLRPVSRMNGSFMNPSYPGEVQNAYYQASLVAQYIEENMGFDAITGLLAGYRDGVPTPDLMRTVLGREPEAFDAEFEQYLDDRFGSYISANHLPEVDEGHPVQAPRPRTRAEIEDLVVQDPSNALALLALGRRLAQEGDPQGAVVYLERSRSLMPEYGGQDGAHPALARSYMELGDMERAHSTLTEFSRLNDKDEWAFGELARIREAQGDLSGAVAALRRIPWVHPYDATVYDRMANLGSQSGDWTSVVDSRTALLALNPVDRAQALYELALAQISAGDDRGALTSVMQALDIAPNFEAALELLLEIREGGDK